MRTVPSAAVPNRPGPVLEASPDGRYLVVGHRGSRSGANPSPTGRVAGIDTTSFYYTNAVILTVFAAATALGIWVLAGRRALWFALAPTLLIYGTINWDLVAVAFATLALVAFAARRDGWTGVLLGIVAASKFYPLLLVIPLFLQGIQDRARMTSLQLRRFTPKDDVQQDFYSGKRIDVAVQSSFTGLRSFFDQMAKYQRIVSITNFEVKQLDKQFPNKTLEARFDLTAYYVSSEKLQKQAAPQQPGGAQSACFFVAAAGHSVA